MSRIKTNYTDRDFKCAVWMNERIQELYNKFKCPNLNKWANDIRLMREHDRRSYNEIYEVFTWANENEFWQMNILSPAKLRAQFDRLTLQMNSDKLKQKKAKKTMPPKPEPLPEKTRPNKDYYETLRQFGFNPTKGK